MVGASPSRRWRQLLLGLRSEEEVGPRARSVAEGDQDRDMVGQRDNKGSNLICGLFQNLDPFSVN